MLPPTLSTTSLPTPDEDDDDESRKELRENSASFRARPWPCSCLTDEKSRSALTTHVHAVGSSGEETILGKMFEHPAGRRFRQPQKGACLRQRQPQPWHFFEFAADANQRRLPQRIG